MPPTFGFNRNASSGQGSQGGSNTNFMQQLQGLFSGQRQGQNNLGAQFANTGFTNYQGIPTLPSSSQAARMGGQGTTLEQRTTMPGNMGGVRPPTYGQAIAGAVGQDYQNAEAARQRELEMLTGLFGQLQGTNQGAGQMVQDARAAGSQGMNLMQQQADMMRQTGDDAERYYREAAGTMRGSFDEARGRLDQGIGTLQESRANYDSTNRSDTAGIVFGIQQQYKNEIDSINSRLSDGLISQQEATERTDQLRMNMRNQSSAMAGQADANARNALAAMDQGIAQMQSSGGLQLGSMGIGMGQAMGALGAGVAAHKQQNEQQITNFYNNMHQFSSSLVQGAQASALQHMLQGNQLAANLIGQMPLGPMSFAETIARMVQATDERRGNPVSPGMGNLFGSMA
jgi:hypothetical protein